MILLVLVGLATIREGCVVVMANVYPTEARGVLRTSMAQGEKAKDDAVSAWFQVSA